MQHVYSVQLAELTGFVGTYAFLPPDGFKLVLRDVDVYANNGALTPVHFRIHNGSGGTIWLFQVDPDTNATGQWRGRQVIEPGHSITFSADGAFDVTASGYQLALP